MSNSSLNAKERANEYQKQQTEQEQTPPANPAVKESSEKTPPPQTLEAWYDLVGNRIEQAIKEGKFDNLRNKGKPLNLARNPYVPEEMELAYHLLENNNLAPAWIGKRGDILKRIEHWRKRLAELLGVHQERLQNAKSDSQRQLAEESHSRQLASWREEVKSINKEIEIVNLEQPIHSLEIFKLRLDDEIAKVRITTVRIATVGITATN